VIREGDVGVVVADDTAALDEMMGERGGKKEYSEADDDADYWGLNLKWAERRFAELAARDGTAGANDPVRLWRRLRNSRR